MLSCGSFGPIRARLVGVFDTPLPCRQERTSKRGAFSRITYGRVSFFGVFFRCTRCRGAKAYAPRTSPARTNRQRRRVFPIRKIYGAPMWIVRPHSGPPCGRMRYAPTLPDEGGYKTRRVSENHVLNRYSSRQKKGTPAVGMPFIVRPDEMFLMFTCLTDTIR